MPNLTLTEKYSTPDPVNPPDVPGWKTYIIGFAGVLATFVLPALHQMIPWVPSLDINETTAVLGTIASLAVIFHRYGMSSVAQYILKNLVPILLPPLRNAMIEVVKSELVALKPQAASAGIDISTIEQVLNEFGVVATVEQKQAVATKLSRRSA